ncbi:thioredoxin family protein [Epilithonimonas hispanica]|uniref:Thioredoxin family protein n=1 Tax=Epilithonimonas hispanica TaxID=358687 RepID=A0A3D9D275_9FLAO|nr:thioredoxin family protein [Epilithonimonas hispanica]REC72038.1 thioredoxin family protein [Epilithonimonas hispanica]
MKISKLIIVIALFAMQFGLAQEKADIVLGNALTQAKTENKNVLLIFHASWCGWCKLMENNMNLPTTKPLFDNNYLTAYVDVQERGEKKKLENPGGQELMNKYKGETAGLPFWLMLSPKGEVLADSFDDKGENIGSPAFKEEVASFLVKLEKTSHLNKNEIQNIEQVYVMKN